MSAEPMPQLLTAAEVAKRLRVSPNKVYELAAAGDLPSYKIGGSRRFDPREVQTFLDERCRPRVAPVHDIERRRR